MEVPFLCLFWFLMPLLIIELVGADKNNDCTTPECFSAAEFMRSKLDESIDPCEDFDRFACGSYWNYKGTPLDRDGRMVYEIMWRKLYKDITAAMEEPVKANDPIYIKYVKHFYSACLDADLIEKQGVEPLINYLKREFGGWPLTTPNWDPSTFDLTDTIIKLNLNNVQSLIPLTLKLFLNHTGVYVNVLKTTIPSFKLPMKYYASEPTCLRCKHYWRLIYQIGDLFGFADNNTAKQEVDEIVDFETKLANLSTPERKPYEFVSMGKLDDRFKVLSDTFDFKRMVNTIMSSKAINLSVTDEELLYIDNPYYLEGLGELLQVTKPRTIYNYLIWKQIDNIDLLALSDSFKLSYKTFDWEVYKRRPHTTPRVEACVDYTKKLLNPLVGKLYVTKFLDQETRDVGMELNKYIHLGFTQLFDETDWLDNQTRQALKDKLAKMYGSAGYPAYYDNHSEMMMLHKDYPYTANNSLENAIMGQQYFYKKQLRELRPVPNESKDFTPLSAHTRMLLHRNYYYSAAGTMQDPLFHKNFPKYLNYAFRATSFSILMGIGFSDLGLIFNKDGVRDSTWLSPWFNKTYMSKVQCFVDQTKKFTGVNGKLLPDPRENSTIEEKVTGLYGRGYAVATTEGFSAAYKGYRLWVERQGKEEKTLPRLNYTPDQMFFISYAQSYCEKTKYPLKLNYSENPFYLPMKIRMISSLHNVIAFSRVFNCSAKAKMNTNKKCRIYGENSSNVI